MYSASLKNYFEFCFQECLLSISNLLLVITFCVYLSYYTQMPCGYATAFFFGLWSWYFELAIQSSFHYNLLLNIHFNYRCLAAKGENSGECERFAKYYCSLCLGEWVSSPWNLLLNIHFYCWVYTVCCWIKDSLDNKIVYLYWCTLSVWGNGSSAFSSFCKLFGLINKMERIFSQSVQLFEC